MRKRGKHNSSLVERVRCVLVEKWDPIGVGDNPMLRDEYDAYIGCIVRMLSDQNTTATRIAEFLAQVEGQKMGTPGDAAKRADAAIAIMELRVCGLE
jgi:hypothetical protein